MLSHPWVIKAPPLKESMQETKHVNSMGEVIEDIAAQPMEGQPGKYFITAISGCR